MPLAPDLFTVAEAAEMLGLSPSSVRYAITRGVIEPVAVHPRLNAVSRSEIDKYRREHLGRRGRPRKKPAREPASRKKKPARGAAPEGAERHD
jgi:hypothetical protein